MRLAPVLYCLASALLAERAAGQSARDLAEWRRLRDSAETLEAGDLRALLAEESAGGPAVMQHLREGLLQLRLGRIEGTREPLDLALDAFCRARQRKAHWWLPWFGIGQAQLALARGHFPVRPADCHTVGTSYFEDAGFALTRALDVSPAATEAAEALAQVVEADTRWGQGRVARSALRRYAASGADPPPAVLLLLARLERSGTRARVLPVLQRYLAVGGDSGIGLLEAARERFHQGDDSGAVETYWEAVRHSRSPGARALLRNGLALIAHPGELAPFDTLSGTALADWVRAFWARREIEAGVPRGARLAEHYRRYEVAWRGFRPVSLGRGASGTTPAYRMSQALLYYGPDQDSVAVMDSLANEQLTASRLFGDQSLLPGPEYRADFFDVRGQVYMRHGPPDARAGGFWAYRTGDGQEYMIRVNDRYPGSACSIAAKYCSYELAGRAPPPEVQRAWETEWQAMLAQLKRSDGEIRHFAHPLTVAARLYTFPRTTTLDGMLVAAFAVPIEQLPAARTGEGRAVRLHLRLVVGPPSGAFRRDRDTVRTFVIPDTVTRATYLQALEPMTLPPGRYLARLTITTDDTTTGVTLAADSLDLGDGISGLGMGDLILSRESSTLSWQRGSERVLLDPLGALRRSEVLRLYYEVAGLTPGAPYQSKVQVLREVGGEQRVELTLSFTDQAASAVAEERRQLGLDRLSPGRYLLRVTVLSEGHQVSRQAPVVITQ